MDHLSEVQVVVCAHAVVAVLFGAGLRLEIFVAAKDRLFALTKMAKGDAENKSELEMGELGIQINQLLVSQFFLVLIHFFSLLFVI